jgi:GMP synthase (glutamine-hydrolysing)
VYTENAPKADPGIFDLGIPVLGICYGHQFMAQTLGGKVQSADIREYGKTSIVLQNNTALFKGLEENNICWMSHTDFVATPPAGFTDVASTNECPVAAMINEAKKMYGVQFHPEVQHTPFGKKMMANFLFEICGLSGDWSMKSFCRDPRLRLSRPRLGTRRFCAPSPAAWILPWRRCWCTKPWANS